MTMFQKKITQNLVSEKVKPPRVGKPPEPKTTPPPVVQFTGMSRKLGAIAKAVTGGGGSKGGGSGNSTPSTSAVSPISAMNYLGRGLASNGKSRPASRARTPTVSEVVIEKEKEKKAATRRRATSLFSKARPFTAQVNDANAHPMPTLNPMKSLSTLRRPHTGVNLNANIPLPLSRSPLCLGSVVVPAMSSPSPPTGSRHAERGLRASHPFAHAIAEGTVVHGMSRSGSEDINGVLTGGRGPLPPPRHVRGMVSSSTLGVPEGRKRPSTAEPRVGMRL
jgi:hypothetical protein